MIVLHYHRLADVLAKPVDKLSVQDRQQIREFRNAQLSYIYSDLILDKTEYGKPIAQNYPKLAFNHSHSQMHYALVHSHDVVDLGVDIEDLNRQVKMAALAKRSFHPQEYQMWKDLDDCREYWFKVWTIKEAVLKAHGLGIRLDLHSLNTQAHPTWDFGWVEHPLLGEFSYQCIKTSDAMISIVYRKQNMDLQQIQW